MAWIESHTVLGRHRKVIELAKDLRMKPAHLIGHLHLLWHAALEQQEDGDLSRWSDDMICEVSGFPCDAPQWVRLLQEHGWLNGKILHDWWDYTRAYLQSKYSKTPEKWQAIKSKHSIPIGNQQETSRNPASPDLTGPNRTLPNLPKEKIYKKEKFAKPTPEEVETYAKSIDFTVNGHAFVDFYESRGWMYGKTKITDWKAAIRTWKRNHKQRGGDQHRNSDRISGAAGYMPGKYAKLAERDRIEQENIRTQKAMPEVSTTIISVPK